MKMKNIIITIAALSSILGGSFIHAADIGIGVFLDRPFYSVDQPIDFYISGFNRDTNAEVVDVHVGVIDGNGSIYEYPNWNQNLVPWLSSFVLPANFKLPVTLLGNLNNFPGGLKPGSYHLVVAFTSPNTLDILSFNKVAFKVINMNGTLTNGGIQLSRANGGSQPILNIEVGPEILEIIKTQTIPLTVGQAAFHREKLPSNFKEEIDKIYTNIEQCKFSELPFENPVGIDAGSSLSLNSSMVGSIVLEKIDNNDIGYGNFFIADSFYQAGQSYTVLSNGSADIPAFSVTTVAPKEIFVTQPSTFLTNVDSSQDFVIQWQGNDGVGEIDILLSGVNESGTAHSISCRVADDGELAIPSELLVQLRDAVTLTNFFGEQVNATLSFGRSQFEFINNDDKDITMFSISQVSGLSLIIK